MLKRDSTNITISEFYERLTDNKYNFDPSYQRKGDVWGPEKKSFLIDTILKNYPMPPIFLHQKIDDEQGATRYDVIDGKQRLSAIKDFIENTIAIPEDFDEGVFGDTRLNGLYFRDLTGDIADFKKAFWRYKLPIEYIYAEGDEEDIIHNVFDRLNRNGEPLNPQELRNARFHDTAFLSLVNELSGAGDWNDKLNKKVKFNRMDIEEFVSDLLFLQHIGITGLENRNDLDSLYTSFANGFTSIQIADLRAKYIEILDYVDILDLDYAKYKIMGVSHIYAIWCLAKYCIDNNISAKSIKDKVNEFYKRYRDKENIEEIESYRKSMEMRTKSKSQRERRFNALKKYCC